MERKIKYLIIDVDGTMTDSGIYYDEHGNELKKFTTRDAAGFFAAKAVGMKTIIVTGRECAATMRRLTELHVDEIFQKIRNKFDFIQEYIRLNNIDKQEIGYIGDDLNDLSSMKLVGFVACPKDSCSEVIRNAQYVSSKNGGEGVVRDVVEHLLMESHEWEKAVEKVYNVGI